MPQGNSIFKKLICSNKKYGKKKSKYHYLEELSNFSRTQFLHLKIAPIIPNSM